MSDDEHEPVPIHFYQYMRERNYDKLDYRDLWLAVGRLGRLNNYWKYEDLDDDRKDNIKTMLQTVNENEKIISVEADNRTIRLEFNNGYYTFHWSYENVRYVKRWD